MTPRRSVFIDRMIAIDGIENVVYVYKTAYRITMAWSLPPRTDDKPGASRIVQSTSYAFEKGRTEGAFRTLCETLGPLLGPAEVHDGEYAIRFGRGHSLADIAILATSNYTFTLAVGALTITHNEGACAVEPAFLFTLCTRINEAPAPEETVCEQ